MYTFLGFSVISLNFRLIPFQSTTTARGGGLKEEIKPVSVILTLNESAKVR
jgi:hypothetical protein